jgi:hypothetical protein
LSGLLPEKLHVTFRSIKKSPAVFNLPRRYTLTHSDTSGDLFLTIGLGFDQSQISGWYTRLMRDEVLAEWAAVPAGHELRLYCHVSGGIVIGPAGWRFRIFHQHMPLVLEALWYGDRELYASHPDLAHSPVKVYFSARQLKYNLVEDWGVIGDFAGT